MKNIENNTPNWIYCPTGKGYLHDEKVISAHVSHFKKNSAGQVTNVKNDFYTIWFIATNETCDVLKKETAEVDVLKTGDKFKLKICNICHCLLAVDNFSRNQTNKHGVLQRPSCQQCRTDIDKRGPKSQQTKNSKNKDLLKKLLLSAQFAKNAPLSALPQK